MTSPDTWTRFKSKAAKSMDARGAIGTIVLAASLAKRIIFDRLLLYCNDHFGPRFPARYGVLSDPWARFKAEQFDRRFSVDTAEFVCPPELEPDSEYGNEYFPTPLSVFLSMLRPLQVDYSRCVFVDLGCGKGKVLLLAAGLPFRKIIGIDFSALLLDIADKNWSAYRGNRQCNDLTLVCADAADLTVPQEPSIFFLYNPFGPDVIFKIVNKLRAALASGPREIHILYLVPIHMAIFDEAGFLERVKQTHLYSIYRSVGASGR